jgi:hypothetical protein
MAETIFDDAGLTVVSMTGMGSTHLLELHTGARGATLDDAEAERLERAIQAWRAQHAPPADVRWPWWRYTAATHRAADRRCGREWDSAPGCGCGACKAARAANWRP